MTTKITNFPIKLDTALPAHDRNSHDLLGLMSLPKEIEPIVLEYADSLSIAKHTNDKSRKCFFNTRQKAYIENPLLQASGCLSASSEPESFCVETAKKVRLVAAYLGICIDTVAGDDSLDLMPTLEKMQPHIDRNLCIFFGKIAKQFPADPSAQACASIPNEAARATAIRLWMGNPQNADLLSKVTTLDYSNSCLSLLPAEIGKCVRLKELYLYGNKLRELPDTLGDLDDLNVLYLQRNQLQEVPKTICNLKNLKELDLSENQLQLIPDEVSNLFKLELLDLSHNKLKAIPGAIESLVCLQKLILFNNQLQAIPDGIRNLSKLVIINLGRNRLETLPKAIGHLNMQGCPLKVIYLAP